MKINLMLKNAKKADGLIPIWARVTIAGERTEIITGLKVSASQWNENTQKVNAKNPESKQMNEILATFKKELEDLAAKLKAGNLLSAARLKTAYRTNGLELGEDFYEFAETLLLHIEGIGQFYHARRMNNLIRKMKRFRPKMKFSEIDKAFVDGFFRFMKTKCGNAAGTIHKEFKLIRTVINKARDQGVTNYDVRPEWFKEIKPGIVEKPRLNEEELDRLHNLELQTGSRLKLIRDMFLFAFYTAGIRIGDVLILRVEAIGEGRLNYRMSKTGSPKEIFLLPQAEEILKQYVHPENRPEDFIFPYMVGNENVSDPAALRRQIMSKTALINQGLKELASMAGIKKCLTTHIARHSFADLARRKGVGIYTIQKALGHSSIKVTEQYLNSLDRQSVDNDLRKMFE